MHLLASKTTIPIPKVHAYSIAREMGPFGVASYMILEYVEGTMLSEIKLWEADDRQLRHLYTQLADVYIQLRQFEFPAIGRLTPSSYGKVEASRRPITNDMNLQVIEDGLQPLEILDEYCHDGVIRSANDYVSMLLRVAWNAYESGTTKVSNEEEAAYDLFNLDMFSTFVRNEWLDPTLDKGPFVLHHGDLGAYNVLVNDKFDILAILDWEWSRTVPRQLFVPPVWLSGGAFNIISLHGFFFNEHVKKLDMFRAILNEREQKLCGGKRLLSDEWAHVHEKAALLIPHALESWTFIDMVALRYLDRYLNGKREDHTERANAFLAARPEYRVIAANKIRDTVAHHAKLRELGIDSDEDKDKNGDKNGGKNEGKNGGKNEDEKNWNNDEGKG